jgi:hypothetical protein
LWDKSFGGEGIDYCSSAKSTSDGGYILCSRSFSGISGIKTETNRDLTLSTADFWILKLDSAGNLQWQRTIGGSNDEGAFIIEQLSDGSYLTGGSSSSNISGDKTQPTKGWSDYWLIHLDASGNILWDRDYGSTGPNEYITSIIPASNGEIYLAGYSDGNANGDKTEDNLGAVSGNCIHGGCWQPWIIRIDAAGNSIWDKTIQYPFYSGGSCISHGLKTYDDCIIIGTSVNGAAGLDKTFSTAGDFDFWFAKYCENSISNNIKDIKENGLTIYPQPASHILYVEGVQNGGELLLINSIGSVAKNIRCTSQTVEINVEDFRDGIYFLKYVFQDKSWVNRIIKISE